MVKAMPAVTEEKRGSVVYTSRASKLPLEFFFVT